MTFSWDFNTATLVAILMQAVAGIVFLVRTENKARSAGSLARQAIKMASEAHEKVAIVQASLGLHREQVAREYIDRDALREMKDDLMASINRLSERIDEALHK